MFTTNLIRRVASAAVMSTAILLSSGAMATADPVRNPTVGPAATLVCGDVTYTVVSPAVAPVGQMLTANGSNSTRVQIMIADKAGSAFPQKLLTQCTFTSPEQFTALFLITPAAP